MEKAEGTAKEASASEDTDSEEEESDEEDPKSLKDILALVKEAGEWRRKGIEWEVGWKWGGSSIADRCGSFSLACLQEALKALRSRLRKRLKPRRRKMTGGRESRPRQGTD